MWRQRSSSGFLLAYLWIMMALFGAIVLETFMIYPNIFHDPPRSLELAEDFMAVRAPNDFFPPLGFASWLTGAVALLLNWRLRAVRYWMLASLAMILGEGLISMLFFWPRNTIMFVEGTEIHSARYVAEVAREFQSMHWTRLAFNAAAAGFVFLAFLAAYRHRLLSRYAPAGAPSAAGTPGGAGLPGAAGAPGGAGLPGAAGAPGGAGLPGAAGAEAGSAGGPSDR